MNTQKWFRDHLKKWPFSGPDPLPSLYFFDGLHFFGPNKGTSSGKRNPDSVHLIRTHGKPRCHELWAPLTYPWRKRAKPLEGRAVEAHFVVVVCVMFCVCVCVCCNILLANRLVESWYWQKQNGRILRKQNINNTTKPPQCYDMSLILLVWGLGTCTNIVAEMLFWPPFECAKSVFRRARFS